MRQLSLYRGFGEGGCSQVRVVTNQVKRVSDRRSFYASDRQLLRGHHFFDEFANSRLRFLTDKRYVQSMR